MKTILLFIFCSFLISSCGKDSPFKTTKSNTVYKSDPAVREKFTYDFTDSGCSTGEQQFSNLIDACIGLKSPELNKSCATEDRKVLFENTGCPGQFDS